MLCHEDKVKTRARTYLILGVVAVVFITHDSGLHATLAGVLTAAAIRPDAQVSLVRRHERRPRSANWTRQKVAAGSYLQVFASAQQALDRFARASHLQHALEGVVGF
jgi:Na+/H+ antiporter NhaA